MAKGGFRGGSLGGGGQQNMLRQAQKLQEEMMRRQAELETATYTAKSGGGAVTATVSGKREIVSLTISPDVADPEDTEMLADLVTAAVNEALRAAEAAASEDMSKLTGGLNLGGLGL
ncbi:MAG: YbaB/EbfC family nucleoid-associated protein [Oscillospiraceae bacterium]|jgi:DNA-binding YbaB/EbfC family protein|nr:YbaB/EbfC family nucleoid-associated protein [Oscillospiraceae bacterium]